MDTGDAVWWDGLLELPLEFRDALESWNENHNQAEGPQGQISIYKRRNTKILRFILATGFFTIAGVIMMVGGFALIADEVLVGMGIFVGVLLLTMGIIVWEGGGVKARVLFINPRGLLCHGVFTNTFVSSRDFASMHWRIHGNILISRKKGRGMTFNSLLWDTYLLWEQMEKLDNPNIKGKWESTRW